MDQTKIRNAVVNLLRSLTENEVGDLYEDDVPNQVSRQHITSEDVSDDVTDALVDAIASDPEVKAASARIVKEIILMVQDRARQFGYGQDG